MRCTAECRIGNEASAQHQTARDPSTMAVTWSPTTRQTARRGITMRRAMRAGLRPFATGALMSVLSGPAFGATTAIKAGRLVDSSGRVVPNAVIVIDKDRITSVGSAASAGRRRGHRSEPVHGHSRDDRRTYTHDVFLGSRVGLASARPAAQAGWRDHGARSREREAHAGNRSDDGARPRCVGGDRLLDARPDRHGTNGRPPHVRRRPRDFRRTRQRARSGDVPAAGRGAHCGRIGLDQDLSDRAAASRASTRPRRLRSTR